MDFNRDTYELVNNAEQKLAKQFIKLSERAFFNQKKVLEAFQNNNVALRHFSGTSGYGYDDIGRDTLRKVFCDIFHTESAIVSPLIVSGTHAISAALFGLLLPHQHLLSISGNPYDTLMDVISGENIHSLKDNFISFSKVDLLNGEFDFKKIEEAVKTQQPQVVFIGRSRGYEWRNALSISAIKDAIKCVKSINSELVVLVDNCYGEFIEESEPSDVGADIVVGSLIKNIGGGIAPSGGYICGRENLVEKISFRLTAPSIGMEVGSYAYGYTPFYQGVFLAPSVVSNAMKGSMLISQVFSELGYKTFPKCGEIGGDIITSINFNSEEELIAFIRSIQKASPVDSNVVPYPWDMPGYNSQVIMAAGTFVQGASIELSADSPIKAPYIAYLQGGLTYEHIKIATMYCVESIKK